jgi:hypothetical protein
MQATSPFTKRLFLGTMLVLLFLIPTLVACGSSNNPSSSSGTPIPLSTAGKPGTDGSTQSVTPGTLLGVQLCPGATKNVSYWNRFILPTSGVFSVESVSCANIIGNPSLQALATVRHKDIGTPLDIYVFNNITDATPKRVFQMFGLVQGEAKISGYNTVLTAQADELSALNVGKPVSAMAADLFREFKWSVNTNMLVQTVFPGVFPDLTRYQAEADQAQVNQGHQPWKLSVTMVANVLAVSLLNWSTSSSTTLLSGGQCGCARPEYRRCQWKYHSDALAPGRQHQWRYLGGSLRRSQ